MSSTLMMLFITCPSPLDPGGVAVLFGVTVVYVTAVIVMGRLPGGPTWQFNIRFGKP